MSRSFRERDVTIIEFGEDYDSLDYQTLEQIGELLLSEATHADPPKLILDLSETQFIGSSFIELLIRTWKRLKERGGTMVLCGVQSFCTEVLQITQLTTIWKIYPSRTEALDAVTKA